MRKNIFLFIGILISLYIKGQSPVPLNKEINIHEYIQNIPNPTAASLGQYADVPVSLYAGLPQINIPIYEIEMGTYTLPISLSYHASGIKVSQEASWVGLGWSLNAGGVITHSIKGTDDIEREGYPNFDEFYPGEDFFQHEDTEPDIFTYNFAGYTGKFTLKKGGGVFLVNPENHLKIERKKENFGNRFDDYWTITTPDGIIYDFKAQEMRRGYYKGFQGLVDAFRVTIDEQNSLRSDETISSWFLTSITLTNGDIIEFTYDEYYDSVLSPLYTSQTRTDYLGTMYKKGETALPEGYDNTSTVFSRDITSLEQVLKEIKWRYGKVVFKTSDRKDVRSTGEWSSDTSQKLDTILVYQRNVKTPLRAFTFHNSYLGSVADTEKAYLLARLCLDSLTISGSDRLKEYGYTFGYNRERALPPKDYHIYDYWGYVNSLNSGNPYSSLIPAYTVEQSFMVEPPEIENLIDISLNHYNANKRNMTVYKGTICNECGFREYTGTFPTIGMLTSIVYPTGGKTTLVYEPNQYYDSTLRKNVNGGGVRIKKIVNSAYTKEYTYTLDNGNSSGILISPPRFHDFQFNIILERSPSATTEFAVYRVDYVLNRFSTSRSPLEGGITGQTIGYSQVKEIKTVDGEQIVEESIFNNTAERQHEFVEFPNKENVENGKLKEKRYYAAGELVKKIAYEYQPQVLDSIMAFKTNVFKFSDNYYVYSYWCPPIEKSEITYAKVDNKKYEVNQIENYHYNKRTFLLDQISGNLSDGGTWERRIRYSADMPRSVYAKMISRNFWNIPVQEIYSKNGKVISSTLITYKEVGNMFLPYQIYSKKGVARNGSTDWYMGSRIPSMYGSDCDMEFRTYDCKGNCIERISEDGLPTFAIWGPDSPFPIAVMRNMTLDEFNRYLEPDNVVQGKTSLYIEDIYKYYPKAEIYSSEYVPLVGPVKKGGPNVILDYFRYDTLGRLKLKLDHSKRILESYKYKYATKP
ncbi:hypothetical protein [Bacteroides sp.]